MLNSHVNLVPIENARPEQTNWQLHVDPQGKLWSIPIVPGAQSSSFGDKQHVLRLMRAGQFDCSRLNEAGLTLFEGLCHRLIGPAEVCYQAPKKHAFLAFAH